MNQSLQKVIVPVGVVGVAVGIIIIGLGFPGNGQKPDDQGENRQANAASGAGTTLGIHEAAFEGDLEAIRAAVSAGESIRAEYLGQTRDLMGLTPLMAAAKGGRDSAIRELISAGAAVDATTNSLRTALMYAAQSGSEQSVNALINAGANVDAKDQAGASALFYAAAFGNAAAAQALLSAGADANARNGAEQTPIMVAVTSGDRDTVLALLNAGADATAEARGGQSVIEMAEAKTDPDGREVAAIIRMALRP